MAKIRNLTADGVDVVLDIIGGGRQLWRSSPALNKGGQLVMLGMASAMKGGIKTNPGSMPVVATGRVDAASERLSGEATCIFPKLDGVSFWND